MKPVVYQLEIGPYRQIGSTGNLEKRFKQHERLLKVGRHYNRFLQRVYNKVGQLTLHRLFECETRKEAYEKEQQLLDKYYGKPYYTMGSPVARGGSKPGKDHPNFGKKRPEHSKYLKDNPGKCGFNYTRTQESLNKFREKVKDTVVCKDGQGNYLRVSRQEYEGREDLVGTTKNVQKLKIRKHIRCLEDGKEYLGIVEAARFYKVPPTQISENVRGIRPNVGVRKYQGGLHFELVQTNFKKDFYEADQDTPGDE